MKRGLKNFRPDQLPVGLVAQLPVGLVAQLPVGLVAQLSVGLVAQLPVGLVAQLVEHCTGIVKVVGSNPVQA